MNIWYVSKYASPSKYFFGTRHFYLAEEWVKMGNDVTVITSNSSHLTKSLPKFKNKYLIEFINRVRTVWNNTIDSNKSSSLIRILSWFHFDFRFLFFKKKFIPRPDVIIVSSLSLTTVLPAWYLAKKFKAKFIFEVRDIWPLSVIVLGGYSKYHPFIIYLSWLEKFGYRNSNLIVGTIPNLAQHVYENCRIIKRCICIPQGLSLRFYEQEQIGLDENYIKQYIPADKFIVCYAGTINVNNPLDDLIRAAEHLSGYPNIHFLILGSGNRKEYFQKISEELNNVTFPPPISKIQVNALLKYVDVCYDSFDSILAKYGLSRNKWIDYMYAKKPIICSFNGYPSMINEANSGSFVKNGESIELAEVILKYSKMSKIEIMQIGINGYNFLMKNRTFNILAGQYISEINTN